MNTKNNIIIGTIIASTFFVAGVFADDSASGSTSSGTTSTGTTDTGSTSSGITSTGVTSTGITDTVSTSTGTISTGATSSGTTSLSGAIAEIEKNRAQILSNWSNFREDYGFIKDYLKIPASKAEAKIIAVNIKNDIKSYHEVIKALIKEGQEAIKANTFDPVVFNTKADEIFAKNIETLSKYVDPAKLEDFKKFMDARKILLEANSALRKVNFEIKQEIKEIKKQFFNEKQRIAIAKKLEARTEVFYLKLIEKITIFSAKTKNETLKGQLEELKEMTQLKLDELKK